MNTDFTKSIICTIDFSQSSKDALECAVLLAGIHKTHLTILFTYRFINPHNGELKDLQKKIEKNALERFSILEEELLKGKGIVYDFKVEIGFISNRVASYVKKDGVSLLVMGKEMNSTNKESFDELAASIEVPFMIVP